MKKIWKNIVNIWDKILKFFGITRNSIYKRDIARLLKDVSMLKEKIVTPTVATVYDAKELSGKPLPPKVLEKPQNTPNSNFNKKVKVSKKGNLYRISVQANEFFVLTANLKKPEIEQLYIEIEQAIK